MKDNEEHRRKPDFPLELLYLYHDITPVAKELDPDRKTLADLRATFAFSAEYQTVGPFLSFCWQSSTTWFPRQDPNQ